jgi:uncharacterized LabA/DUF88 family protein
MDIAVSHAGLIFITSVLCNVFMADKAIILIDGNNLYHNLKEMNLEPSDLDFFKFSDFVCLNLNVKREHIIYYNSIPKMSDPVYFKHKKFLEELEKSSVEVKTRKLQYKSTKEIRIGILELINKMNLCEKCKPAILTNLLSWVGTVIKKEKGIDVMMAVDIISNVIDKKYDYVVVISGDADLVSAMKFAENKGGKILSAFVSSGYSDEIKSNFKHFKVSRLDLLKNCLKDEAVE